MNPDVQILRALANRAAECAADPANAERAKLYRAVNDRRMIRPVVLLDEIPWNELEGEETLRNRCTDPDFAQIETYLRREIYLWENAQADRIFRPYLPVPKAVEISSMGLNVREEERGKAGGGIYSHRYENQLRDDGDLDKIREPEVRYDPVETMRRLSKAAEAVGDILPVKLQGLETGYGLGLKTWDDVVMLMGAEQLLYELCDRPEFLHRIARKFCDIFLRMMRRIEEMGLLEADQILVHSTPALSDDLARGEDRGHVTLDHCWGRGLAQIFASVSKDMRMEFDIAYQIEAMQPFCLVYYGCCEPLHDQIDILSRIPNLRKVSITPWADVDAAAEALGRRYVMAWKPNPAYLLRVRENEPAIRGEIRRALAAAKRCGTSMDMVLKDISSISGNPENLRLWARIAREEVLAW
ncbi:MAG: hypothetical protein ACOX83_06685 [Candidatus Spyradocola sp.]|jgi:hypothetical protein